MNGESDHGEAYQSVMAHVTHRHATLLFTGDIYRDYERNLLQEDRQRPKSLLKAQVLKITHHGSAGGTGEEFVKYVRPLLGVASTAKRSDGSPDPDHNIDPSTANTLQKFRVKLFQTADSGTITVKTDGMRQRKGILYEIATDR